MTQTVAKVVCGGCNRDYGHVPHAISGLYSCGGCAGLIGRCTENEACLLVHQRWESGPTRDDEMQYVDIDIVTRYADRRKPNSIRRFHGWINSRTRNLVQVG